MKNISSKSKNIAKAIIFAQLASDGGKKNIYLLNKVNIKNDAKVYDLGYKTKDGNILKAIELIDNTKNNEIRYSVISALDQNGYDSFITYFTFMVDGNRYQISFHTPKHNYLFEKYICNSSNKTHWNHELGGSQQSCIALAEYFGWKRN